MDWIAPILFALGTLAAPPADDARTVLVLATDHGGDPDGTMAAFTGRVVVALHETRGVVPITAGDLDALLEAERIRDLVACSETNCLAELAGAAGAEQVLSSRLVRTAEGFSCFLALHDIGSATVARRWELRGLREIDPSVARRIAAWVAGASPRVEPVLSLAVDGPVTTAQADALAGAVETSLAGVDARLTRDPRRATHFVEVDVTTLEVVKRRHHIHRYFDGTLVATLRVRERGTGAVLISRQVRATHSARARYSTAERVVAELFQEAAQRWSAAIRAHAPF